MKALSYQMQELYIKILKNKWKILRCSFCDPHNSVLVWIIFKHYVSDSMELEIGFPNQLRIDDK
jgi:hypothetical protein